MSSEKTLCEEHDWERQPAYDGASGMGGIQRFQCRRCCRWGWRAFTKKLLPVQAYASKATGPLWAWGRAGREWSSPKTSDQMERLERGADGSDAPRERGR